jgi:hypothetical protein
MATAVFAEMLEIFRHSTRRIPESRSHTTKVDFHHGPMFTDAQASAIGLKRMTQHDASSDFTAICERNMRYM